MMQEFTDENRPVQSAYEAAQDELGLVGKLKTHPLKPAQKDIIQSLYEQSGRVVYQDMTPSFMDPDKPLHTPTHRQSLLYHSSVYLQLSIGSLKHAVSEYDPSLAEEAQEFYQEMLGVIKPHLPKNPFCQKISDEVKDLMEEFYDWHIRPTLSAARDFQTNNQTQPKFKEDLRAVRRGISDIYGALVQGNDYNTIEELASTVLGAVTVDHIDQHYPTESKERNFLVNLHAGAYFLKYVAQERKRVEELVVEEPRPKHEQRFEIREK